LPPYRALANELNFCNAGGYGCGSLAQAINGLAQAEKRLSEGKAALALRVMAGHSRS
jgi:hypothetical protein